MITLKKNKKAPYGQVVLVTGIEQFYIEGRYDVVSFIDVTSDEELARFSGSLFYINPFYSTGRDLLVRFTSDSSASYSGFKLFYEFANESSINTTSFSTTQSWPIYTNADFTSEIPFNESTSNQTSNPPITQTFPPDSYIYQQCVVSNSLVSSYGYFQSLF